MTSICMIVFSYYPEDPRPRREAEALVGEGIPVDIICLRKGGEPKRAVVNGVRVYRLPMKRRRSGKLRYVFEYLDFILLAALTVSALYIRERYKLIHVHNMPDILVFSALIPKLCGAKIILDLHDPMPEVFMAKYAMGKTHNIVRLLRFMEKWSIRFSNIVITPNVAFRNLFISRGCPPAKIRIIMNSPQESIFHRKAKESNRLIGSNNGHFVIMYHGTIVERNGIGVGLEAIAKARRSIPGIFFKVYGEGDFVGRFLQLIDYLDLKDIVHYHGHIPAEQVAAEIESADIGLVTNIPSRHWDMAFPTRIFEYLCMGKPVIAPRTRGILDYFSEDALCFFDSGNSEDLCRVILSSYRNSEMLKEIRDRGVAVYMNNRWDLQKKQLIALVHSL